MQRKRTRDNRRAPRLSVPTGVWVAWYSTGPRTVSRVQDLSLGGVFIATPSPLAVGANLKLLFSLAEGEIHADAVVRFHADGKGMGVEFTHVPPSDRARLEKFVKRLSA